MIWGAPSVPAMTFWGSVVLCALLLVVGLRLLRGRRRAIGGAVLAVALMAPLAARAITLPFTFANGTVADATQVNANFAALNTNRAYGFIAENGVQQPGNVGIVDVVLGARAGEYCFKLGFQPVSAVATLNPTFSQSQSVPMIIQTAPGFTDQGDCPSDHQDAEVIITGVNGGFFRNAFSVVFQ
jgi:hypothetical protein